MTDSLMHLNFKYRNRIWDLKFNNVPVMQIVGDTAVGKSLFCHDLAHVQNNIPILNKTLLINQRTKAMLDILFVASLLAKYDLIVIDNADILITNEIQAVISAHKEKHWIIIGHGFFWCVPGYFAVGALESVKSGNDIVFTINYGKKC